MFVPLFPFPVPIPSSGNSSCPLIGPPTEPRFESRRCALCYPREKNRPIRPPISKWQIGLSWRQKVARRDA